MTEEQKAEQAWIKEWIDRDLGMDEFLRLFKSSLKRMIKGRIKELELLHDRTIDVFIKSGLRAQITENKRFLKLLDEVEPNT